ncbi:MAG: hypothetical protein R3E13_08405 [Alphaproteobacteria bacterium]
MKQIPITALFITAFFILVLPHSAAAQRLRDAPLKDTSPGYMDTPYYNKMVRDALKDRSPYFDFMQFRILYARTRQYDPGGERVLKTVNDLAYLALHEEDPQRAETALFAYQTEVSNHLANIDVVLLALSLAREDKRFGRVDFFEWMREGLVKTVLISGDGYTLNGAYDVITLSEELLLFSRLGLKRIDTKAAHEGIIYYNMHTAEDLRTGEKRTVFVNTSIPMRHLEEAREKEKSFTLDLRKR